MKNVEPTLHIFNQISSNIFAPSAKRLSKSRNISATSLTNIVKNYGHGARMRAPTWTRAHKGCDNEDVNNSGENNNDDNNGNEAP